MNRVIRSTPARRSQRGISVLESLIAFVVLGASTLAVGQLQSQLRLAGDIARERTEALRLGQRTMDALRSFALVDIDPSAPSFAAIDAGESVVAATRGVGAQTSYRIVRRSDEGAVAGAKAISIDVRWTDRSGAVQAVALQSFIAGVGPAYSGALALDAGALPSTPRGARARTPFIPIVAHDLGDGRSAWRPSAGSAVAFLFDNVSGAVVGRCDGPTVATTRELSAGDVVACTSVRLLLVGGTVRFGSTSAAMPSASDAPLALTLALMLRDGSYPMAPSCFSEAQKTVRFVAAGSLRIESVPIDATPSSLGLPTWQETGDRFVDWHCLVAPRADGRWSGRATIVASGWTIGSGARDRRVCRYVEAGTPTIDANIAHPADYANVDHALVAQNFLIVRGSEGCPHEPPTEPQQP